MKAEYLTQKEVCEILGISRQTFARERIGERLGAYRIGKKVKYKAADIERLRIR